MWYKRQIKNINKKLIALRTVATKYVLTPKKNRALVINTINSDSLIIKQKTFLYLPPNNIDNIVIPINKITI
ncbi:hypothetical protein AWE27_11585, partial [Escherichia coli]